MFLQCSDMSGENYRATIKINLEWGKKLLSAHVDVIDEKLLLLYSLSGIYSVCHNGINKAIGVNSKFYIVAIAYNFVRVCDKVKRASLHLTKQ